MAYVNVYKDEITDVPEAGSVLSHPSVTKTLYLYAWRSTTILAGYRVYRGDPVVMVNAAESDATKENNGLVMPYEALDEPQKETAIVGIALADAKYTGNNRKSDEPIPIAIAGDVMVTVPSLPIKVRGEEGKGLRGHFYPGEYVSVDGRVSTSPAWPLASQLVLGQILAGKTRANRWESEEEDILAFNRLYHRFDGDIYSYYHIPVRLTIGARIGVGGNESLTQVITATNNLVEEELKKNDIVVVTYQASDKSWKITGKGDTKGNFSNGLVVSETISATESGLVAVTGSVKYGWYSIAAMIAQSNPQRLTPFVAKIKAAAATNDEPELDLSQYYVGQRVTDDLVPILDGVPDNQFGTIESIDPGIDGGGASITVKMDPVSTDSPAYESNIDTPIDAGGDIEDLPVGTSLVENPITHVLTPCRFDTDNVDATVIESVELPQINGWGLEQYRRVYGDGVYMANGRFWKAIKKFGKGVYKKVIKPAAKWAVSIVAPVVGGYITALGHVVQSQTATVCGQLLNTITPPNNGETRPYLTIHGKMVYPNDGEEILQEYADFSGSFADTHQNVTGVWSLGSTNDIDDWALGDCISVDANGNASKITSYDQPITAVCNWLPAQDPVTNGWKIAGITKGRFEFPKNVITDWPLGTKVGFDLESVVERIRAGLPTGVLGTVREVWKPSQQTLDAVKAGKLPADEAQAKYIIDVAPEYYEAASVPEPTYVTARNADTEEIPANTSVVLTHNPDYGTGTDEPRWVITIASKSTGDFANGIVKTAIEAGEIGNVMVTGEVNFTWTDVARIMAGAAKKGLFNSRIAKAMAVAATNEGEVDLNDYFVGMRVTDDLLPILDGVPDNQFGTITSINTGQNGTPSITVKLDAVATNPPAYEAIADVEDPEDLPIGTSLVENPITHKLVPCRFDTDNVDATAVESIELPEINGWGLEDYRRLYGDGVYEWNGSFWRALKKFGKGIYKKVIKPAAKWAISIIAPVAGSYVTGLGNVLRDNAIKYGDQLLNAVTPVNPAENQKYTLRTIHGKTIITDEPTVQAYVSCSGSFADTHPNVQEIWPLGSTNDEDDWALGDCIAVDADGNATKITSYDQPIKAVCNWLPAQDPVTNGWKITGIVEGCYEIRSANLKVGERVLYDGTSAESRITSGQATGVTGKVVSVWQPSQITLDAIKAGKLPKDEELPNCIVKVSPEYYQAAVSDTTLTEIRYYDDPEAELNIDGNKQ